MIHRECPFQIEDLWLSTLGGATGRRHWETALLPGIQAGMSDSVRYQLLLIKKISIKKILD